MPPKKSSKGKGSKQKREQGDSSDEPISKKQKPNESAEGNSVQNDASANERKKWNKKLCTWNVNGIRAWLQKNGLDFVRKESPDVFCLQETKCADSSLPSEVKTIEGYHCYWLSGDKDGYSGVGLLSKEEPKKVTYGIGVEKHDKEGRVITAEYDKFILVGTYVPNAGRGLVRLDYRMDWDKDFREYLQNLSKTKPVILCGDLNVAHKEIDLANPKTNKKNAGFTQEERDGFTALLSEGFVDSFRQLYPDRTGAYTFWTYMMNARAKNVGWRLDYFVLSEQLMPHLSDCVINNEVLGSDHCPVTLYLDI